MKLGLVTLALLGLFLPSFAFAQVKQKPGKGEVTEEVDVKTEILIIKRQLGEITERLDGILNQMEGQKKSFYDELELIRKEMREIKNRVRAVEQHMIALNQRMPYAIFAGFMLFFAVLMILKGLGRW